VGVVGGTPAAVKVCSVDLEVAASGFDAAGPQLGSVSRAAAGACGHAALAATLERFGACWSQHLVGVGIQTHAAALLAKNSAEDLEAAGGGGG
jgi:hypothetical protein